MAKKVKSKMVDYIVDFLVKMGDKIKHINVEIKTDDGLTIMFDYDKELEEEK